MPRCVFCQSQTKESCHRVLTFPVATKLSLIGKNTEDEGLRVRFALIADAIADDILYHLSCLVKHERAVLYKPYYSSELDPMDVADVELLDWLVNFCQQSTEHFQINSRTLHEKYVNLLVEIYNSDEITASTFGKHQYKKHIKDVIEKNLKGFKFVQSFRKNEPEILTSEHGISFAVNAAMKTESSAWALKKVAQDVRSSLSTCSKWKFNGRFSYESPLELRYLLKLILYGENTGNLTHFKSKEITRTVNIISQLVSTSFKSNKSVRESTINFVEKHAIKKQRRFYLNDTPVTVGLGILLHGSTGMRGIVEDTSDLNITCKYQTIKKIEAKMLEDVKTNNITESGIYIPKNMSLSVRPYFAIDNTDFQRSSKDGKGELHGTLIVMFQNSAEQTEVLLNFGDDEEQQEVQNVDTGNESGVSDKSFVYNIQTCYPPKKPDTRVTKFRGSVYIEERLFTRDDEAYAVIQTCDDGGIVPTWKVYNSKLCENIAYKTTYAELPLLKTSPTDWSTLYTALKICQGISTTITPNKRTIITLDLQLYIKAIQLSDKIGDEIFLRVGELHVLFAMSHAIGKYIDSSGLDKLFTHCGIYSHLVVNKILEGKNMKRCLDAFLILYSSLFQLLLKAFYVAEPSMRELIVDLCRPLLLRLQTDINVSVPEVHQLLLDRLQIAGFFDKFDEFRANLKKQARYLSNVVTMIGKLLLYVRATRQKLWNLHLASQDSFVKYFFSLDLQNYARMMPVHLSHLYELKEKDDESWNFLKENFTCNKTISRFTGIGVDHALEQVNKELKGVGGIVGMSDAQIDKFCLTAPTKRALIAEFADFFDLRRGKTAKNQSVHHEETGSHQVFHHKSVKSYNAGLMEFLDLEEIVNSKCCHNIMTHSILTDDSDLVEIEQIGEELYDKFIEERGANGPGNVWDKLTKRKLLTFRGLTKCVKLKIKDKIVNLREERSLMTRLLVISRSRPGIDIAEQFAKHEFSVVPHSLFDNEGKMLKCSDKAAFLRGLEEMSSSDGAIAPSCVVLDGMGFANQLKMKDVTNLSDLIAQFTGKIEREISDFDSVVLVFDSYDTSLNHLKQTTWDTRHKVQVQFKLSPSTVVKDITLKELLSHPQNKRVLTEYFAKSLQSLCKDQNKTYVIAYGTTILSNVQGWSNFSHKHPEADTLMLCIIKELAQLKPNVSVLLISPDTDVLILALHFNAIYPSSTVIFELLTSKGRRKISTNKIYEAFGAHVSKAVLGYYVFTGCDQLSAFNSITKDRAFKKFLALAQDGNSEILTALSHLGEDEVPSTDVKKMLEKLVVMLYSSKRKEFDVRYNMLEDVGLLRWELYSKFAEDSCSLPPTPAALKFHILRANYIALAWKRYSSALDPDLPNLVGNGWDESLTPVLTDELPAPEFSLELTVCKCKKTNCANNQCSCRKHKLACTEACQCSNCENEELSFEDLE